MLLALADLKRHRSICILSFIQILDETVYMKVKNSSDLRTLLNDKCDTPSFFFADDVFKSCSEDVSDVKY